MRRASSKLLFHIPKIHTHQTLISPISKDFSHFKLFPNLDSHGFWPCASHNFNTLAGSIPPTGPQLPFKDVQFNTCIVKTASIDHLKKSLQIKKKLWGEDDRTVGDGNLDMAQAYVAVWNFQEALPFCSKALDIHKTLFGDGSFEVAYDRRLLGIIYTRLGEHEKALEENQLSRRVLEKWVRSTDLLLAEIDDANRRGRHEEAIEIHTQTKITLKKALTMLEKIAPEQRSVSVMISVMIFRLLLMTARISRRLLMTAKLEEAVPFLEDVSERLKERFGSKHFGVGYVYNHLGAAYLVLGRPQSAAQAFAHAKEIMEVTSGSHHMDTIEACQNLSKAYAAMGSYPLAINIQEKVVEGLEGHGPSARDELDEAAKVLEQLKEKASAEALLAYNNSSPAIGE